MKSTILSVLVAGFGLAAFSGPVQAGANANAKILIHLLAPTTKACGTRGQPGCGEVNVSGGFYPNIYYAHLIVMNGNATAGIGGLQ